MKPWRFRINIKFHLKLDRPILPAAWQLLDQLLPHLSELRAVCFECEGAGEKDVLATLRRLRDTVKQKSGHPELAARA